MQDSNTSYITQSFMWERLGLSGTLLTIYAIIYSFSKDGRGAFHGKQEYLAKITGTSRATVNSKLKELVKSGLILEGGNSEYRTKIYRVNLEKLYIDKENGISSKKEEKEKSKIVKDKEIPSSTSETVNFFDNEIPSEMSNEKIPSVKAENTVCKEILHNNKKDNKEIRQQNTSSSMSARERRGMEGAIRALKKVSQITYLAKKEMCEEVVKSGADIDTRDYYEKEEIKAGEILEKYEYAECNIDLIDTNFLNSFDFYGPNRMILLTPSQYSYLSNWVGYDVLTSYLIKLEKFLLKNYEYQVHSHYAILKKWISADMEM